MAEQLAAERTVLPSYDDDAPPAVPMRSLGRPTPDELDTLMPTLGEGSDQARALADIFWALLNSREFLFNH